VCVLCVDVWQSATIWHASAADVRVTATLCSGTEGSAVTVRASVSVILTCTAVYEPGSGATVPASNDEFHEPDCGRRYHRSLATAAAAVSVIPTGPVIFLVSSAVSVQLHTYDSFAEQCVTVPPASAARRLLSCCRVHAGLRAAAAAVLQSATHGQCTAARIMVA
jgi:hypothetical protein